MKATVYYFHADNDNGVTVSLHTTREALVSDIEECVRSYNPDRATRMESLLFESAEWLAEWEEFRDSESYDCNYFSYGDQELEFPL